MALRNPRSIGWVLRTITRLVPRSTRDANTATSPRLAPESGSATTRLVSHCKRVWSDAAAADAIARTDSRAASARPTDRQEDAESEMGGYRDNECAVSAIGVIDAHRDTTLGYAQPSSQQVP